MNVDLSIVSFEKAIASLNAALQAPRSGLDDSLIRDACIQRFKYTYELSHKALKRFLELTSPNPSEIDTFSFQMLIRAGSERGLLMSTWPTWATYRAMRASTGRAYEDQTAQDVFETIPQFCQEATFLHARLSERTTAKG